MGAISDTIEIEFLSGPRDGDVVVIAATTAIIGNGPEADVALRHDVAARPRHALVDRVGETLRVTALEVPAGVLLNGETFEGQQEVVEGDVLRVGNTEMLCRRPGVSEASPAKAQSRTVS